MGLASTKGGGMCAATGPDVCKVPAPPAPPVPTPFPNMAQVATAMGNTCSTIVKILNMPVAHKSTEIPATNGDEAGVAGGVVSGTFGQKMIYRMGVSKVKVEGNEIVSMLKQTAHNGSSANAPAGSQVSPSQTKVFVPD